MCEDCILQNERWYDEGFTSSKLLVYSEPFSFQSYSHSIHIKSTLTSHVAYDIGTVL